MATVQQLVGRWRLVESKGFDEYMKEVGGAQGPLPLLHPDSVSSRNPGYRFSFHSALGCISTTPRAPARLRRRCVDFCHTARGTSHDYACILSLPSLPPFPPPHSSRSSQST
ncbi:fatty acid-binding protein 5 isoform X2 [Bubalus bubalis]|uniref:fatty acid-binding protein 5 isoform X2 n=1 Tax=Bubalus bubalis TaxID=89462 RepID=UPI001D10A4AE|nr:fatty acid-binding protein 5 isoform X2 [Bubalus bubalis]